ncbi:hypothetical protein QBC40DRAFT_333020 [Triangularia verruculosa]|uniref:Uncharacterized protein n=1 Tax=Triangularia verruculosa TaxID=2587418 RepID=A0AAN7AT94_9PEZI|nr:hypothetical protein QBC40DRAFT_333020 [Triangularia verruculosa]
MQPGSKCLTRTMSRIKDKLQPSPNHHGEIPIPSAINTPIYHSIHQQPTTTATTAIRSIPKLVCHHPRRLQPSTPTIPHPRLPTTIHHSIPLSLTLLTQLKSFLLLPPTTPTPTVLLNLLTKHHKIRLDLPKKDSSLASRINIINWRGIHKHRSLSKSERWVLKHFAKSRKGLFEMDVEPYDLPAIASRLDETKKKSGRGKRLGVVQEEQEGEMTIGMEVRLVAARYRPCTERYFPVVRREVRV